MIRFFFNPFGMVAISFGAVLLLYQLPWSSVYPEINGAMALFLLFLLLSSGFFYQLTRNYSVFKWSGHFRDENLLLHSFIALAFVAINLFHVGHVPVLVAMSGAIDYNPKDVDFFPVVYPLTVAYFYSFGCYFFYNYLCSRKVKYLAFFVLFIFPSLLFVQRGIAFSYLSTALILYLMRAGGVNVKRLGVLLLLVVLSGYVFGYLGSLRESNSKYYRPITDIGNASAQFMSSGVSDSHFYLWLYLTSPLANFQRNVVDGEYSSRVNGFEPFLWSEIVVDVVSKRAVGGDEISSYEDRFVDYRIEPTLNVGTMFTRSFSYMGWLGVAMVLSYFYFVLFVYLNILRGLGARSSPYATLGVAFLANFSLMMVFDNMLPNSARFFPLLFPIFFGWLGIRKVRI